MALGAMASPTSHYEEHRPASFLDAIHQLRYQVYCLERQFLDLSAHPEGLERDEYDRFSVHFAATDESGEVVATSRLVLDSSFGFPLEHRAGGLAPEFYALPRSRIGEISRLILATPHRGTAEPALLFGLLKELFEESRRRGLHGLLASMEPRLARLLRRFGFAFSPIGPAMEYFGLVTPYWATLDTLDAGYRKVLAHLQHVAERTTILRYSDVTTPEAEESGLVEQWTPAGAADDMDGSLMVTSHPDPN
ncbi:MAG TPA: GNAT family N-acyltransferase [Candidatus Limnocylindrales bacterium]|nr:GNAT family N-acyltransferase [Candidatus Limnocylindrales bacterium]